MTFATNLVHPVSDTVFHSYQIQRATGADLGTIIGGDAQPVLDVQPKYFGKSIVGIRCAAIVSDLSWMRSNCSLYEFIAIGYDSSTRAPNSWFVSGVMNVTTDESYDPFDAQTASGTPPTEYALFSGLDGEMFED